MSFHLNDGENLHIEKIGKKKYPFLPQTNHLPYYLDYSNPHNSSMRAEKLKD